MTMNVKMTGRGELPLPPEAVKALGGAGFITVETSFGNIVLRPSAADAAGAVPVHAGVVTLPDEDLESVLIWRYLSDPPYEAVIEDAGYVVLGPSGDAEFMAQARREFAGEQETETEINRIVDEVKQKRYEAEQTAERGRVRTEQRKAL